MSIELGSVVYFAWYDFDKQLEHICSGEVVDNSDYVGTQWADYVNVSFCPPGFKQPICHHFLPEKLSAHSEKVAHDDCYLVCHKRPADNSSVCCRSTATSPSDAWQSLQQFKEEHWDQEHNHLRIDALEDFYRLWRIATAAKYGMTIEPPTVLSGFPAEAPVPIVTEERYQELKEKMITKLTRKQLHSTGRIQYTDSIQTSIFD